MTTKENSTFSYIINDRLSGESNLAVRLIKKAVSISRPTLLWLCTFILPLAFGLLIVKTYKLLSIQALDDASVKSVLFTLTTKQSIYCGIFLLIFSAQPILILTNHKLYGKYDWFFINVILIITFFIGFTLIKLSKLCGMGPFAFLIAFKQDILFILFYLFLSVILLELSGGRLNVMIKMILSFLSTLFLLIVVTDILFFTLADAQGDWFLIKFSIMNLSQVWALGKEELSLGYLLLLASPLIVYPFILVVQRIPNIRAWFYSEKTNDTNTKYRALVWALAIVIVFGTSQIVPSGKKIHDNFFFKLGKEMFTDIFSKNEYYHGISDNDEDIFDSSQIELVKTSNTILYNIVIILLESFHAKSTTPYNPALHTTPFLNFLSKNSLLTEKMFSLNYYTTDGIITVFCGNYPPDRRYTYYPIFYKGLPDLLKPHGYISSYFSGQKLNYEHNRQLLKNIGFDEVYGQSNLSKEGFLNINWTGYEERITLKPSLKWIDNALENNKNFLITYLVTTSHQPYNLPKSLEIKRYVHTANNLYNKYLNSLKYVDGFLEDLFKEFKKRKLFDTSIFILVGDHGDNVGRGLRKLTEPSYHIPCLILGPSIKGFQSVKGMRQQVDILPTIIDYFGFKVVNGRLPGSSLFDNVSEDRLIFFRNWNPNDPLLVRTGPYKFIFPKDDSPPKVHNIELDPDEIRNISDHFSLEYIENVKRQYLHWHKRVNYNYYRYLEGYQRKKG